MASGTTTNYGDDVGIGRVYRDGFVNGVFKNNHLLGLTVNGSAVFPRLPAGDQSYRWKVMSSANTSAESFTESASAPTPVAIIPKNAVVSPTYFWAR